jgi:hypothetical protein
VATDTARRTAPVIARALRSRHVEEFSLAIGLMGGMSFVLQKQKALAHSALPPRAFA